MYQELDSEGLWVDIWKMFDAESSCGKEKKVNSVLRLACYRCLSLQEISGGLLSRCHSLGFDNVARLPAQ